MGVAVLDEKIQQLGEKILRELADAQSKCESEYSKQKDFCRKYCMLLSYPVEEAYCRPESDFARVVSSGSDGEEFPTD